MSIREELRAQMLLQRKPFKRVAEAAGISSAAVSKMLAGDAISPKAALGFESVLGIRADDILSRQAEEQKRHRLDLMLARLEQLRATTNPLA